MKCVECSQRKAKRFCPAKNKSICPQCCGEKRVIEISCPPDCPFLKSGQAYHWLKKYMAMLQNQEDPSKRQRLFETSQKFHDLISHLERVITEYAVGLTSITDRDVLEAIRSLRSTYQTEQKGVIYEHASSNPLAQALFKELRSSMEKYRSESTAKGTSLRTGDVVACLEFVEVDVDHHLHSDSGQDGYLRFIARNHPDLATGPDQGGIILAP